jgi:hypothetical protein
MNYMEGVFLLVRWRDQLPAVVHLLVRSAVFWSGQQSFGQVARSASRCGASFGLALHLCCELEESEGKEGSYGKL